MASNGGVDTRIWVMGEAYRGVPATCNNDDRPPVITTGPSEDNSPVRHRPFHPRRQSRFHQVLDRRAIGRWGRCGWLRHHGRYREPGRARLRHRIAATDAFCTAGGQTDRYLVGVVKTGHPTRLPWMKLNRCPPAAKLNAPAEIIFHHPRHVTHRLEDGAGGAACTEEHVAAQVDLVGLGQRL